MKHKMKNVILKKCKSLSMLGRSSSYSSLRSNKFTREGDDDLWFTTATTTDAEHDRYVVVLVGSSRRPHMISSKHLNHPLLNALLERSRTNKEGDLEDSSISVNCEVLLFNHLLWMLENADPEAVEDTSMEELADLYS